MPLNNGRSKSDRFVHGYEANANKTKRKKNVKEQVERASGLLLFSEHRQRNQQTNKTNRIGHKQKVVSSNSGAHPMSCARGRNQEPFSFLPLLFIIIIFLFFFPLHSEVGRKTRVSSKRTNFAALSALTLLYRCWSCFLPGKVETLCRTMANEKNTLSRKTVCSFFFKSFGPILKLSAGKRGIKKRKNKEMAIVYGQQTISNVTKLMVVELLKGPIAIRMDWR